MPFGIGRDRKEGKVDRSRIEQAVRSASSAGVKNLSVQQKGDLFEIHGFADSIREKQDVFKKITDQVGETSGVVNLIQIGSDTGTAGQGGLRPGVGGPLEQTGASPRTHVVKKGETLSHLAQKYYGKASEYNKIFEANRDQLNDPDKIREGMTLKIPQ